MRPPPVAPPEPALTLVPDAGPSPGAGFRGVPGRGAAGVAPGPAVTEPRPETPAPVIARAAVEGSPSAASAGPVPAEVVTEDADDRWLVPAGAGSPAAVLACAVAAAPAVAVAWLPGPLVSMGVPAAGTWLLARARLAADATGAVMPVTEVAAEWPAPMTSGRADDAAVATRVAEPARVVTRARPVATA